MIKYVYIYTANKAKTSKTLEINPLLCITCSNFIFVVQNSKTYIFILPISSYLLFRFNKIIIF